MSDLILLVRGGGRRGRRLDPGKLVPDACWPEAVAIFCKDDSGCAAILWSAAQCLLRSLFFKEIGDAFPEWLVATA